MRLSLVGSYCSVLTATCGLFFHLHSILWWLLMDTDNWCMYIHRYNRCCIHVWMCPDNRFDIMQLHINQNSVPKYVIALILNQCFEYGLEYGTYIRRWPPCYKTVICNEILICMYVHVQWNHQVTMWFLTVSNMNHRFYEWSNDYQKSIRKITGRHSQVFACKNDAAFEQYCMQNSLTVNVNIKILQPNLIST